MSKATTYICREPISYNGKRHEPNTPIKLPDADAGPLLAIGHIALASDLEAEAAAAAATEQASTADQARKAKIVEAMQAMDPANDQLWTAEGAPTVAAIEGAVGFDITEAERDLIWAELKG